MGGSVQFVESNEPCVLLGLYICTKQAVEQAMRAYTQREAPSVPDAVANMEISNA